jgi:hypothetical protein
MSTKPTSIPEYNKLLTPSDQAIAELLLKEINQGLPGSESKIWHAHPVWFLNGNPIVGYHRLKDSMRLLFWSGQSFDEPRLEDEGSFKAAQAHYTSVDQINLSDLQRWLKKSAVIQWDYKNIVKRRGVLEKINV